MENEKRLIERFTERLKEAYPQNDRNNPSPAIYYDDFCDIVDEVAAEMEAMDAVEVVWCKDCKFQGTDSCETWHEENGTYRDNWILDNEDDFCSYGERRTDG